uniref:Interferon-induced GTP-binding protein Mx n=1 Tax=Ganoderma boninense TaxID=34458 RepID=A0A5K1K3L7_9APHY|nr:Interferon-induced GTP-binding protein Mx [Ganoderma boninense]
MIPNPVRFAVGDALVWWRACVVWKQDKAVCSTGPPLITLTLGVPPPIFLPHTHIHSSVRDLMSPTSSASPGRRSVREADSARTHDPRRPPLGKSMRVRGGVLCVLAAAAIHPLTLSGIQWKTSRMCRKHRRLAKAQFAAVGRSRRSEQVLQVQALALLVQSGSIDCAIISVTQAFATVTDAVTVPLPATSPAGVALFRAIYPATVIVIVLVLVALKRSTSTPCACCAPPKPRPSPSPS